MDRAEACPSCHLHRMAALKAAELLFGKMRERFGTWWEE
jgi:hypothetical protein